MEQIPNNSQLSVLKEWAANATLAVAQNKLTHLLLKSFILFSS
jgi:hypothetical protein